VLATNFAPFPSVPCVSDMFVSLPYTRYCSPYRALWCLSRAECCADSATRSEK